MLHELGQLVLGLMIFFKAEVGPPLTSVTDGGLLTCLPDLDNPLHCDTNDYCQCCLKNGSSLTGRLSAHIKACSCLIDRLDSSSKKGFGHFVPRCESDGTYSKTQRHSSSGKTWCAHPYTGKKLTSPNRELKYCDCFVTKSIAENRTLLGVFVPTCETDGSYSSIQHHSSTGMSWCVEPVVGLNLTIPSREPVLSCDCPLQKLKAKNQTGFGHFVPKCAPNGNYEKFQRYGSNGKWWCTHPKTGQKVTEATREDKIKFCDCLIEKFDAANRTALGLFEPNCEEDGSYSPLQTHSSTGLSYCAVPETGEKAIEPRSTAPEHCHCFIEAFKSNQKHLIGRFTPKCEENGAYALLQFHPSTGMSWCVNPSTGQNTTIPNREANKTCAI